MIEGEPQTHHPVDFRPASPAAATDAVALPSDQFRRAELDHLYQQAWIAVCVNVLLASIVAWAYAGLLDRSLLLGWWGTLVGINLIRLWQARRYQRLDPAEPRRPGLDSFVGWALASGAAWGLSAPVFLESSQRFDQQVVVMVVIAGLAAGAIPVLAAVLRAYLCYLAVLLAPPFVWLLLGHDQHYTHIGLMTLVFAAALASAGRNYAANAHRSEVLAAELGAARTRTEQANAELEHKIAETVEMQDALNASEYRFQTAFEQAPIGIALMDPSSRLTQANTTLAELLGYPVEQLLGRRVSDLVLAEDRVTFERHLTALVEFGESRARFDLRFIRADGQTLWVAVAMAAVAHPDPARAYLIIQFQDITDAVELSARLEYEAAHDELTGFVNRREFERRLARLLAIHRKQDVQHTICYLDLDRFKVINDSEGHVAGDEVLRQVASMLQEHIRGGDTIARIGGDEFAVLLEHCDVTAACRVAETLVAAVNEFRFCWNDKVFRLDISIGVASIETDHHRSYDVLRIADAACAAAKEAGGARVHVYRAHDEGFQRRQGEIAWLGLLTDALDNDGFELYAQPIMPLHGDHSAVDRLQFEVLVRMRGARAEALLPAAFLPAAERYGFAARIDRWVIDAVFSWFRRHPGHVRRIEACAINLSGASLGDADFTEHVMNAVRSAPLDPARIRFEITETAAIVHLSQARQFMGLVQSLGCGFSLDDFGSGLSSFGYLRSLPVDALKIDGQFVRDIVEDQVDRALVKSINEIGRVLGLTTIAEHVENEQTLELLREIGVDLAQGFHLGTPRPLAELLGTQPHTAGAVPP